MKSGYYLVIWAVINTVVFDLLGNNGCGFKMRAPLSKSALHIVDCGFMNDTDIVQIGLGGIITAKQQRNFSKR